MVGNRIGEHRADAVYRILFVIVLALGGIVVLGLLWALGLLAGVIWMLVDLLIQLARNREGWSADRMGAGTFLERLFYWPVDMLEWLIFGTGTFPWLP